MNRKLVYIGFAFAHHKGTHAGYHQLESYLDYDYVIDCQSYFDEGQKVYSEWSIVRKLYRKLLRRLFHINNIPWYLVRILWLGLRYDNLVFHYIYGENVFFPWVKKLMRKGNIIVCTFHQPYSFFQTDQMWKNRIMKSDYIILVGNTEVENFKNMTGKDNVVYIPHGITTDYYAINYNIPKKNVVLTVGNWLRDYQFADMVYLKLLKDNPNIEIHIVSNPRNKEYITSSDRIKFMSGITDDELREEYLKSSVLFLPLTRYTANNSLLEASATGCNIVIASDYPDNSYIPEKYLSIVKMNVEDAVVAIENKMSLEYNDSLSTYVDNNYSWQVIADKIKLFLLSLKKNEDDKVQR